MKIFQKTRKVAKKKSTQPKKQPQEVYARAAAPTVGKKKKRKRPNDEGLALGPLTARQRRCVAAAAAGAGLAVARRPDVRGVQAAPGKRRRCNCVTWTAMWSPPMKASKPGCSAAPWVRNCRVCTP